MPGDPGNGLCVLKILLLTINHFSLIDLFEKGGATTDKTKMNYRKYSLFLK